MDEFLNIKIKTFFFWIENRSLNTDFCLKQLKLNILEVSGEATWMANKKTSWKTFLFFIINTSVFFLMFQNWNKFSDVLNKLKQIFSKVKSFCLTYLKNLSLNWIFYKIYRNMNLFKRNKLKYTLNFGIKISFHLLFYFLIIFLGVIKIQYGLKVQLKA